MKRECAASPYFHLSQFPALALAYAGHSCFATDAIHRDEVLALIFANRWEVVGNNLALASRIS